MCARVSPLQDIRLATHIWQLLSEGTPAQLKGVGVALAVVVVVVVVVLLPLFLPLSLFFFFFFFFFIFFYIVSELEHWRVIVLMRCFRMWPSYVSPQR